jgi:gas vesicle protein
MAKKNNRGLVVIERGASGSGVLWLLLGGAIGAGLGLLLAPHSGKKSRELLGERLKSLKASAEETLEELSEEAEDQEELLEDDEEASAPEAEAPGEDEDNAAEPEPRRSTPTARGELEQRLARARARRHRALVEEDEEPVA